MKKKTKYHNELNIRRQGNTFQFEEDPFSKNVEGIGKIYHEVLLLMKFLQTKPLVKNLNISSYDWYSTVIKSRGDIEIVNENECENDKDYYKYNDFFTPNN